MFYKYTTIILNLLGNCIRHENINVINNKTIRKKSSKKEYY